MSRTPERNATLTPAARGRTGAILLALGLAATACGSAPAGRVASGARPAAGTGSGAVTGAAAPAPHVKALRHRVRPDVLVVSPRALPARTVARLKRLAPAGFTTFRSGRATLNKHGVSVAGVDPSTFRSFAPQGTAESDPVWQSVGRNEVVVSHALAKTRHLALGATVTLGGKPYRVGAFATTLPDVDAVVSNAVAGALHLPSPNAALLTAGRGDPAALATATRRVSGQARIHLLTQPRTPYAFLTGSSAAKAFGAFSYRWFEDGTIQPDARWVAANIVSTTVPILGRVTCHRLIVPQLRAALREIEALGLAAQIRSYEGCYVPRFIERNPDGAVSLHTWGIAFDLNASTNGRGGRGDMDIRVVNVFKKWGFRWGGDWSYTDPMHFELGALMQGVS